MTDESPVTSARLTELLRMRRFIDQEIREERQAIALGNAASLVQAAADLYGTTVHAVIGSDRQDRAATAARMMACWLLREVGKSYPEIGRMVGRDHSTVMYACRTIAGDQTRVALARQLLAQEVVA